MSMAALVPGLQVKVEGTYDNQNQLVAKSVSFKGNDLEEAEKIQAGMHETKAQVQQNQAELEKQNAALKVQNEALQQQQAQLTEHQAKIAANKAAVDAAIAEVSDVHSRSTRDQQPCGIAVLSQHVFAFPERQRNSGADHRLSTGERKQLREPAPGVAQ